MPKRHARKIRARWYEVPVTVLLNDSRTLDSDRLDFTVLAPSAAEAANWVRDNEYAARPETEIIAWGPKGGEVRRYVGWDSAVYNSMIASHREAGQVREQLTLGI